jgi:PrgI family protein
MQYKIPVQIENEDTIFLGLSLRQLGIIMGFGGVWYSIFRSIESVVGPDVAGIPAILILVIGIFVAIFKNSEMTFLPFILNMMRLQLNTPPGGIRYWNKGTESYGALEIGYVTSMANAKKVNVTKWGFHEVADTAAEQLSKL